MTVVRTDVTFDSAGLRIAGNLYASEGLATRLTLGDRRIKALANCGDVLK